MDVATELIDVAMEVHVRGEITIVAGRTEPPPAGSLPTTVIDITKILIGFFDAERKDSILRGVAAFGSVCWIIRVLIGDSCGGACDCDGERHLGN